jgi:polysaccharide export outer membrane protein
MVRRVLLLTQCVILIHLFSLAQELANNKDQQSYLLGPGDLISVRALHATELSDKPARLDADGYVSLPMVGRIKASGLTTGQLAALLRKQLDDLIRDPEVSVELMELKSHPVSVIGAVKNPGVYQLQGQKRLLEVISLAGGVDQDAGFSMRISRDKKSGRFPLPPSQVTESGGYWVAEVSLEDVVEGRHPEHNLIILPDDVITIPRAKLVYVIGEVHRSGGFVLRERQSMSVLQALSMAEGLTPTAGSKNAKIFRPIESSDHKTEIPVNIREVLAGKASDPPLLPNDILFIPNSASKSAALRGIETAIQMGTGVVIWRR